MHADEFQLSRMRLPSEVVALGSIGLARIIEIESQRKSFGLGIGFLGPLFGKYWCLKRHDAVLILATNGLRPCPRKFFVAVTLTEPMTYHLPSYIPEDFFLTAEHLGIHDHLGLVYLNEFLSGRMSPKCKPIPILEIADATAIGLDHKVINAIDFQDEGEYWWQPCGGILSLLRIDEERRDIARTVIAQEVGNYTRRDGPIR